jgi:hypothetical protein
MTRITICGGGNAAHALAGIFSSRKDLVVHVYAPFGDEALRWNQALDSRVGMQVLYPNKTVSGHPAMISANPAEVVPGAQILMLALPAFAHEKTLRDIAPHLTSGAWIGTLPARGGFGWAAREVLGAAADSFVVFGLQTLPWACRITEYGREVTILGTKKRVDLAIEPLAQAPEVGAILADLLGLPLDPIASFLSLDLAGTGQLIHSGIMYGLFHQWDGTPYTKAPLFYQGVDDETSDLLESMSEEVQVLRAELKRQFPRLDLSAVRPLHDWILRSYTGDIADPSTLRSSFVTNRSYAGLLAPMISNADGLVPDFNARYLSEDIPFGLVVARGIAELAKVKTPVLDKVIIWSQHRLNNEYLSDGKLQGRDLSSSRAPQRYGINQLSQLVHDPGLVRPNNSS